MAKKTKSERREKREKPRERRERRFEPLASADPRVVYLIGAIGAIAMGAGAWGQFGVFVHEGGPEPLQFAPYILALGALLVGGAIWIGTSGDPALRVGDAGLAVDKGGVRRMPWYAVERMEWRQEMVRVTGKDDAGVAMSLSASLKSHPQAAAWMVREARERVPTVVDVPEDATLPEPRLQAGEPRALDAPQVVGKHCAASGKVIAYEPDGRICPRCERVFHKASVPATCDCGASLVEMQSRAQRPEGLGA